LPYVSYVGLGSWLWKMASHARDAVSSYFSSFPNPQQRSASGFYDFCVSSSSYSDASNPSNGVLFGGSSYGTNDTLVKANAAPTSSHE
jgi:hypothetical protein